MPPFSTQTETCQDATPAHLCTLIADEARTGGARPETISHRARGWARGTSRCWAFRYPIERSKHSRIGPSKVGARTKTQSGSGFAPISVLSLRASRSERSTISLFFTAKKIVGLPAVTSRGATSSRSLTLRRSSSAEADGSYFFRIDGRTTCPRKRPQARFDSNAYATDLLREDEMVPPSEIIPSSR